MPVQSSSLKAFFTNRSINLIHATKDVRVSLKGVAGLRGGYCGAHLKGFAVLFGLV